MKFIKKNDTRFWQIGMAVLICISLFMPSSIAGEKIKDLVNILNEMDIHVEGFGIVTGLDGQGDKSPAATMMLKKFLEKNNLSIPLKDLKTSSIALVRVAADIPPNLSPNQRVTVRVSAIGNPQSLSNGSLERTFLKASNGGEPLMIAYGSVQIGGSGDTIHNTRGRIPANQEGGGQLIRALPSRSSVVEADNTFTLKLKRPSFENAANVARAINSGETNPYLKDQIFGSTVNNKNARLVARAVDKGTVIITIPNVFLRRKVEYIYQVLDLQVTVEKEAVVTINRATNLIIMSREVSVDPIALSMNGYQITIGADGNQELPQPGAKVPLVQIGNTQNLQELINALNAMNASTRDIAVIVQALYEQGSLHCKLIIQ